MSGQIPAHLVRQVRERAGDACEYCRVTPAVVADQWAESTVDARARVEEILYWLPADTRTVVGGLGPFDLPRPFSVEQRFQWSGGEAFVSQESLVDQLMP